MGEYTKLDGAPDEIFRGLIIETMISRDNAAGAHIARVTTQQTQEFMRRKGTSKKAAAQRNCAGKVDKALELFDRRIRDGDSQSDEGSKVIHNKPGIELLKNRIVLVAVEVEGAQEVLQAPEGGLDGPALEVNIGDDIGREGILWQIRDEEFIAAVVEHNADEAEVQGVAGGLIVKEGEAFPGHKLEVAGRIFGLLFGIGECLVEGLVEGFIQYPSRSGFNGAHRCYS